MTSDEDRRRYDREDEPAADPPPRQGWLPTPDPTVLTTQSLMREVASLRRLVEMEIQTEVKVVGEQFKRIDSELALVERQRVENKHDTGTAVAAALAATDKAFAKSEVGFKEQLGGLSSQFDTAIHGIEVALGDVKERVTKLETVKRAQWELTADARLERTEVREGKQLSVAQVGAMMAAATFIVGLLVLLAPHLGK